VIYGSIARNVLLDFNGTSHLRDDPMLARCKPRRSRHLDILRQKRRDKTAAKRFFTRELLLSPAPHKIVIDPL